MKEIYQKAVDAYISMLDIHINTKTKDVFFHKETESFYETLFEIAHKLGEKHVNLGGTLSEESLSEQKKQANQIISNLRKEIETYKENNKVSLGTEDLLGTLADDLENIEGSSKAFL